MNNKIIAIVGLGYVGLPLAVEFGKKREVIGYDINQDRVNQIESGTDITNEMTADELKEAIHLSYTTSLNDIRGCDIYIITVPTPIDIYNKPNLTPLKKSSESVGKVLKKGDIVIYESTVYPGCTEEDCVPVLEKGSGLKFKEDFKVGYSPERINPGDTEHTLTNVIKVVSGCCEESLDEIAKVYEEVVQAGVHRATTIKVAEAAKIIENTQRDLNIALVNELSIIFNKLDINTYDVLEAAGTKWNFLKFFPGLVGGHCIGVDPYYLTYKAEELGSLLSCPFYTLNNISEYRKGFDIMIACTGATQAIVTNSIYRNLLQDDKSKKILIDLYISHFYEYSYFI